MTKVRDRRLDRIASASVTNVAVPHILRVAFGETLAEARARFDAAYPQRSSSHGVLVLPSKPRDDAERELWAERFYAGQMALVADARRTRIAVAPDAAPRSTFPPGTPVPPKGRALTHWQRNT